MQEWEYNVQQTLHTSEQQNMDLENKNVKVKLNEFEAKLNFAEYLNTMCNWIFKFRAS